MNKFKHSPFYLKNIMMYSLGVTKKCQARTDGFLNMKLRHTKMKNLFNKNLRLLIQGNPQQLKYK